MGSGWSYFVENKDYIQHISENTTDIEVRADFTLSHKSYVLVRLLAVALPSTLSTRRTINPPKIASPLVSLPVYVRATVSCKRMVLAIYNAVNGAYDWILKLHASFHYATGMLTQTISSHLC